MKSFIEGGNEIRGGKVLVCVKSVGSKRTITTLKGATLELTEVVVFDDTADIVLKLWGDMGLSARDWKPSCTVLLFSNPGFRFEIRRGGSLWLNLSTMVDVEPEFPNAAWLRKYARTLAKKESVDQTFPADLWDLETAQNAKDAALFTLADIDEV